MIEDIPSFVDAYFESNLTEKFRKNAQETLDDIANSTGPRTEALVTVGRPATAILEVAEDKEPDLIIIASHRPGLTDYFIGSTASRVVSHAKCPVLVER